MRIRGINGVSPKVKKILQLLRLRQIQNGVFVKVRPFVPTPFALLLKGQMDALDDRTAGSAEQLRPTDRLTTCLNINPPTTTAERLDDQPAALGGALHRLRLPQPQVGAYTHDSILPSPRGLIRGVVMPRCPCFWQCRLIDIH